jgi:hypothetical protein
MYYWFHLTLRVVHVLGGIFWVGTVLFNALFLAPAVRDAGPDGAKVMAGLMKRNFAVVMPIIALLTIISGVWLYYRASVGFQPEYVNSGHGMAFATGGLLAIISLIIGLAVLRPAMIKMTTLAQSATQAPPAEREKIMAALPALRARTALMNNIVSAMLVVAAIAMAVARYL